MTEGLHIVWFKRDLRIHDHAPLLEAAGRGPVLPLYVVEPELWRQPDMSGRHWAFVRECLIALRAALGARGQPLVVRTGDIIAVLEDLRQEQGLAALWSHEETGNGWTYARDRKVRSWARAHGLPWHERRQHGVVRGLQQRTGWARQWERLMNAPLLPSPRSLPALVGIAPGEIPSSPPGLADDPCPHRQEGGRAAGRALLTSFLEKRGRPYRAAMASPLTAGTACSRLSPHLAYGTLSIREVHQAARARREALMAGSAREPQGWPQALQAFDARLHWHCHFIQKLESAPAIESRNLHPAYDGLRPAPDRDEAAAMRFTAWATGRTGWPFLDASMAMLRSTGWINFRMRAMLMAVAAYQLFLDWRAPGLHLARLFTDYEPGIHWSQSQMQSSTTGINMIRMYNPVKQGKDQDPDGLFVRRYLPALADVPTAFVHEPWRMPPALQEETGCVLGRDYPTPVVDHVAAARRAREIVWRVRREAGYARTADAIQERHGSRRSGLARAARARRKDRDSGSGQFDLEL